MFVTLAAFSSVLGAGSLGRGGGTAKAQWLELAGTRREVRARGSMP